MNISVEKLGKQTFKKKVFTQNLKNKTNKTRPAHQNQKLRKRYLYERKPVKFPPFFSSMHNFLFMALLEKKIMVTSVQPEKSACIKEITFRKSGHLQHSI